MSFGQEGITPEGANFLWSFVIWGIEISLVIQVLRLVGELCGGAARIFLHVHSGDLTEVRLISLSKSPFLLQVCPVKSRLPGTCFLPATSPHPQCNDYRCVASHPALVFFYKSPIYLQQFFFQL